MYSLNKIALLSDYPCIYEKKVVPLQGEITFNIMIITTTQSIQGHTIREYKGLVSGEVIFGLNFVKDLFASVRDFVGGRSNTYEKAMIEGREQAQREMEQRARAMGANAIVGVSYGYETVGPNGSMLLVSISGTAVVVE